MGVRFRVRGVFVRAVIVQVLGREWILQEHRQAPRTRSWMVGNLQVERSMGVVALRRCQPVSSLAGLGASITCCTEYELFDLHTRRGARSFSSPRQFLSWKRSNLEGSMSSTLFQFAPPEYFNVQVLTQNKRVSMWAAARRR